MEEMEQFAEMMKAMQAGQGQGKGKEKAQGSIRDRRHQYRFTDPNEFQKVNDIDFQLDGPYANTRQYASYGADPLMIAMKGKSWKKLDIQNWQENHFLRHSYDPNFHPVHSILSHPNWSSEEKRQALQVTLMYGPDIQKGVGQPPVTPLQAALRLPECKTLLSTLLDAGANPNAVDRKGSNAIMDAIQHGNPEVIPMLLRKGAKLSPRADGQYPKDIVTDQFYATGDLKKWFNSMAHLKKFKMHPGDELLSDQDKELMKKHVKKRFPNQLSYLDNLFQALDGVDANGNVLVTGAARPFTNPSMHISNHQGNYVTHPWFSTFPFSIFHTIQQSGDDERRLEKTKEGLAEIKKLLDNPESLTDKKKEWFREHREELALDLIIPGNAYGDCLLTAAARQGDIETFKFAMELNVNLNTQDHHGNTAMHLLTSQLAQVKDTDLSAKRKYFEMITQLVGLPEKGGRKSMFEHGATADWFIMNANGQHFIDVLQQDKPAWADELRAHLGIQKENIDLNLDAPGSQMALGYDESLNRKPEDIPLIDKLSSISGPTERYEKIETLGEVLVHAYDYLGQEEKPEIREKIKDRIRQNLEQCEPDVKLGIMFGMAASLKDDNIQSTMFKALEGTLANIAHDMQDPRKKEDMFEAFDQMLLQMESNGSDIKAVQNLATQLGIMHSNPDLISLGQKIEHHLSKVAEKRYGNIENEQDINSQGQKPNQ